MVNKYRCTECDAYCTLERSVLYAGQSPFPPEQCIYKKRGSDKEAIWKPFEGPN